MIDKDYKDYNTKILAPQLCERLLKNEKFVISYDIPRAVIENSDFNALEEQYCRSIILRMKTIFTTDVLQNETKLASETKQVKYPISWWDHFKLEALPTFTKWFKLKINYNVEEVKIEKIVKFERKAAFPDHVSLGNDFERVAYFEKIEVSDV